MTNCTYRSYNLTEDLRQNMKLKLNVVWQLDNAHAAYTADGSNTTAYSLDTTCDMATEMHAI